MVEVTTKLPAKSEQKSSATQTWQPFESLKRQVDRLFEDFEDGFWGTPNRRSIFDFAPLSRLEGREPAVDVAEKDKEFEITAEMPGMEEKDIEVKLANGGLSIRGEKKEAKEEKQKNYHVSERRYGAFERYFTLPDGVDAEKISAAFKNGVLTVTLPKTAEAQKQEKKIPIKAAA